MISCSLLADFLWQSLKIQFLMNMQAWKKYPPTMFQIVRTCTKMATEVDSSITSASAGSPRLSAGSIPTQAGASSPEISSGSRRFRSSSFRHNRSPARDSQGTGTGSASSSPKVSRTGRYTQHNTVPMPNKPVYRAYINLTPGQLPSNIISPHLNWLSANSILCYGPYLVGIL